jgi:hypothetical protein
MSRNDVDLPSLHEAVQGMPGTFHTKVSQGAPTSEMVARDPALTCGFPLPHPAAT